MIRIIRGMTITDILFAVLDEYMPKNTCSSRTVFTVDQADVLVAYLFIDKLKRSELRHLCSQAVEYKYLCDLDFGLFVQLEIEKKIVLPF